jgi:hypothetical protein
MRYVLKHRLGVMSAARIESRRDGSSPTHRWREPDSNRRSRLLTFDHEELVGRGFGPPNLALATSKLPHAGVAALRWRETDSNLRSRAGVIMSFGLAPDNLQR